MLWRDGKMMEEVTYLIEDPHHLDQGGSFQNLQTLVDVSLLQQQGDQLWPADVSSAVLQQAPHVTVLQNHPARVQQAPLPRLEQAHPPPRNLIQHVTFAKKSPVSADRVPQLVTHQAPSGGNVHYTSEGSQHGGPAHQGGPPPAPGKRRGGGRGAQDTVQRTCHVCGEKAGRHSYYGGQTCPSCRAFFRRSVQSGYNATYFCVKEGRCEITLKTRKNCQYCRYKKCEACGMKTTWVLTDEERRVKFEGRRGKGKTKSKSGEEDFPDEPSVPDPRTLISEEELVEVNRFVRYSGYWDISKVNDMEVSLIREIIRMVAFRHMMSEASQTELKSVIIKRARKFANDVQDFQSLSYNDRQLLLSSNLSSMLELQVCTTFNPELLWTEQFAPLLGQEEVDKLDNKLRSLNVTGLDQLHLAYHQFFPSPALQADKKAIQLMRDIGIWSQDEKEYVLVSLVLLFCPDQLDLAERKRVEDLQEKFATLLQKYLNYKHQSQPELALSRFTSSLLLVSRCKEFALLTRRREFLCH